MIASALNVLLFMGIKREYRSLATKRRSGDTIPYINKLHNAIRTTGKVIAGRVGAMQCDRCLEK